MIDGGKGKGIIQGPAGKASFGEDKIKENIMLSVVNIETNFIEIYCIYIYRSFIKQIRDDLRPPGAKAQYFLKVILSSTRGRGYQVLVDDTEPFVRHAS